MLLGGELVEHHAALGLPHALNDDLTGGLGGDAAEVLRLDLDAQHVAQLGPGQSLPGVLKAHLGVGVIDGLHHVLLDVHADLALFLVGVHGDVVGDALVVPLVGGHQRLGDLLDHVCLGDALFLLDVSNGGEELLRVQLRALGSSLFLSHVN